MTVSTQTPRASYAGSGSPGPFAIPYRFLAGEDLLVTILDDLGTEHTLAFGTDFSVTGENEETGTLTLADDLAIGEDIFIRRAPALEQPTSIANQGPYFPRTIETALDRLTMQMQSLKDEIDRSFKLGESADPSAFDMILTDFTAGKVVTGTGTGLTMSTLDSSAVALPGGGRGVPTLSAYLVNNAVYNVKDYLADPGGLVDTYAELQDTLDAAGAAGGGIVLIPNGRFRTTVTLTKPEKVSIVGYGGEISIIAGDNCDAIALDNSSDIGSVVIQDFGIEGTNCTTRTALKSQGGADSSLWTNGVHIARIRVTDYQTAMRFRNLHRSTVRECWFQRINIGLNIAGQNMVNWFENNWMIYDTGCGVGTKAGVIINSASDYDPGGVTVLRPESVHINRNFIYGFEYGVDVIFATFVDILHNDISALIKGIQVATVDGVFNIKDNYVEVTGGAVTHGIHFVPLSGVIDSEYNVVDNHFLGATTPVASLGCEIGTFGVGGNQSNIHLIRNRFVGFRQFDISISTAGDIDIIGNQCLSANANSCIIRGNLAGRGFTIDQNRFIGNLNVPVANGPNSQFNIGYNRGTFSTRISGTISVLNGAVTATLNYAALAAATANFDTLVNTGLKFQVRFGAPDKNIGAVWGSATATAVTINCGVASVGTTIVPFEVYVVLSVL